MEQSQKKWGWLRETPDIVKKAGYSKEYDLGYTPMMDYLKVIFPSIKEEEWIQNKKCPNIFVDGKPKTYKPDFRNENLKLIIEVDGLLHYTQEQNVIGDREHNKAYLDAGYKLVRIPYFIQLSNNAVRKLFDVNVEEPLFDENIPSIPTPKNKGIPTQLCSEGLRRMAEEFHAFPEQYKVNLESLKEHGFLEDYNLLKEAYDAIE